MTGENPAGAARQGTSPKSRPGAVTATIGDRPESLDQVSIDHEKDSWSTDVLDVDAAQEPRFLVAWQPRPRSRLHEERGT